MSFSKRVTIKCDGDDCRASSARNTGDVWDARRELSELGWTTDWNRDLCPRCSAQKSRLDDPLQIEESWKPLVQSALRWLQEPQGPESRISHHGIGTPQADRCYMRLAPVWRDGPPCDDSPPGRPTFVFNLHHPHRYTEEETERVVAMVRSVADVVGWWNGAPGSSLSVAVDVEPDPSLPAAMGRRREEGLLIGGYTDPEGW